MPSSWGKLQRNEQGEVIAFHGLLDHMTDVAFCFLALAQCEAIKRAMQASAGRVLTTVDLQRLAVLVFLHDIGKANAGFQSKWWLSGARPKGWPLHCGHGPEAWALVTGQGIPNAADVLSGVPLAEMATWGDSTIELLQASISHHGRPVADALFVAPAIWRPVVQGHQTLYDPAKTVADMGASLRVLFPLAFELGGDSLPDQAAFVHFFAGLVQLADWLGSDTREGFFPYTLPGEDRAQTAAARARFAVHAIGLDVQDWRTAINQQTKGFAELFGVPSPRPMQAAMADVAHGPLVILEAETGSGKTEAALWRFATLFKAGAVDSLYFALPTRVAASQLYERIRDFVKRAWPEGRPVVVRALPGYEAADGEKAMRLPDFKVQWPDNPGDEVAHLRWVAESPKRFLAATIAVGTIDQALLGGLTVRHAHLRQALLARSLLVVDEVHASDTYMTVLLEQLLKAHAKAGGHAMLLSATLGSAARTRYLNVGQARKHSAPSLAQAQAVAYPAISTCHGASPYTEAVQGNPRQKTVHWQTWDVIDQPALIAERAVEAAAQGARVLIVRNTVPAAAATLQAVEALVAARGGDWLFKVNGISTLHHSRFSRQDRPLLDREVERQLGKVRSQAGGRIVIGTQTLEQSLDIDADLLITDLCPMDVLLQRLGRLHRHQRPSAEMPTDLRPAAFQEACAWVLTPSQGDLAPLLKRAKHGLGPMRQKGGGIEGVYPDLRMLEATRRLIAAQPSRTIPLENRTLVEQATHGEALDAIAKELGAEWQKFGQDLEGSLGTKANLGHLHALPYDQPFSTLTFPDSDQKIATRLGAADRLIEFTTPLPGPFGLPVYQLALRFHQVPAGLAPDAQPTGEAALPNGAGFEFTLGATRYRYSRLGLERLKASDTAHSIATPTGGDA